MNAFLVVLALVLALVGISAVAAEARRIPAHITAALSRAPLPTEDEAVTE